MNALLAAWWQVVTGERTPFYLEYQVDGRAVLRGWWERPASSRVQNVPNPFA